MRKPRHPKPKRQRAAALKAGAKKRACPMRAATVEKIIIATPKKPNSAQRKTARVRITEKSRNGGTKVRKVLIYIPDQKHTTKVHDRVMMIGGKCQDTPGTQCTLQRGVADNAAWSDRKNKRSKYGVKKPKAAARGAKSAKA